MLFRIVFQKYLPGFCFLLFACIVCAHDAESAELSSVSVSQETIQGLAHAARRYRSTGRQSAILIKLPLRDKVVPVTLVSHDLRAPGYRAEIVGKSGSAKDSVQIELFKGKPGSEEKGAFFRFALIGDSETQQKYVEGYFSHQGRYYNLAPSATKPGSYVVHELTQSDLQAMAMVCGLKDIRPRTGRSRRTLGFAADVLRKAEVATEADFEFTQALGGASIANASILSILNGVDAIYREQLNLTLSITYQRAWIVPGDPYSETDPGNLLDQFRSYWNAHPPDSVSYDLAHLWTGRNLDSNVIGVAYKGTVCSSAAYGLSQKMISSVADVLLAAHEIGHNFDSDHDTCTSRDLWIMCPWLNLSADAFSPDTKSQIKDYANSASCLSEVDDGGDPDDDPDAPVLSPIGPKTLQEGQTLTITLSATDKNGGSLTYDVDTFPEGASFVGRVFTYTPPPDTVPDGEEFVVKIVVFSVTDATGLSDSETVAITIQDMNQAPVLSSPPLQRIDEGEVLQYQLSASDADSRHLSFLVLDAMPDGASFSSGGLFSWRPAGNQSGSYDISVRVTDSHEASDSGTLSIIVNDVPGVSALPTSHTRGDFDGDGSAEVAMYRTPSGEWFSASLAGLSQGSYLREQFGFVGTIPVPADYNGDHITDRAVYDPSDSAWYLKYSGSGQTEKVFFGSSNDLPVLGGDYDGDGRDDIAMFRPSLGTFLYRPSGFTSSQVIVSFGLRGDIPVPCDYNGDAISEFAVFRPATGQWYTLNGDSNSSVELGNAGDIPLPADYDGDGNCERVVYRPASGEWIKENGERTQFGLGGDVPVSADYDGDGLVDFGVWRAREALWYIAPQNGEPGVYQLGLPGDLPSLVESYYYAARNSNGRGLFIRGGNTSVLPFYRSSSQMLYSFSLESPLFGGILPAAPNSFIIRGDYDGDGVVDNGVFYAGLWTVYGSAGHIRVQAWGQEGDLPVTGDFDGDGVSDIAILRPNAANGFSAWYIIKSTDASVLVFNWGLPGDVPVVGDFNGDGWSDPAVWRPTSGVWYVLDGRSGNFLSSEQWGLFGDVVKAVDFDKDGRSDKVVWRSGDGTWYQRFSGGNAVAVQWGLAGDIPVPGDYSIQGIIDYAVYRSSTSAVYVRTQQGAMRAKLVGLVPSDRVIGLQPYTSVK